jgi:hypothetical protein
MVTIKVLKLLGLWFRVWFSGFAVLLEGNMQPGTRPTTDADCRLNFFKVLLELFK